MRRASSLEKTLLLEGLRQEEKGVTEDEMAGWHHRLKDMSLSRLWEIVKGREAWHAAVQGVAKGWTLLSA